jgi:hypothetical protein
MSENNINPEVLADEELDAVSGGGCCDYIACPRGYDRPVGNGGVVNSDECDGCDHLRKKNTSSMGTRIATQWYCERPKV